MSAVASAMTRRHEVSIARAAVILGVSEWSVRRWVQAALAGEPSKLPREIVRRNPLNGWYYLDADGVRELRRRCEMADGANDDLPAPRR